MDNQWSKQETRRLLKCFYCLKFNILITDKSHHLACIQLENLKDVAYGCRDVAIILRQPKLKKVTEYQYLP